MSTSLPPGQRASVAARLALGLGAALVTVGVLELGGWLWLGREFVRGFPVGRPDKALAQYDAELGWVSIPGVTSRVKAPLFSYRVDLNSRALRDSEHPYEKPPGVFRVVLLGDSIGWGWGVDNGLCFADLIERDLEGVEVINLSVPGYSTDQQLLTLEKEGLRYQPDLVLLCFVLNDVEGNETARIQGRVKPFFELRAGEWILRPTPPPPAPGNVVDDAPRDIRDWLYWHSALLQALRPPDADAVLADDSTDAADQAASEEAAADAADGDESSAPRLRPGATRLARMCDQALSQGSVTRMLFQRLSALCASHGLPLVAFTVAHHHDHYLYWPRVARPKREADGFSTRLSRSLEAAGLDLGFHTFSVDAAMFLETGQGRVLTCGDGHLNERGNEVVARRTVEELAPLIERLRNGTYARLQPRGD